MFHRSRPTRKWLEIVTGTGQNRTSGSRRRIRFLSGLMGSSSGPSPLSVFRVSIDCTSHDHQKLGLGPSSLAVSLSRLSLSNSLSLSLSRAISLSRVSLSRVRDRKEEQKRRRKNKKRKKLERRKNKKEKRIIFLSQNPPSDFSISPSLSLPLSPTIVPFQRLERKQGKKRARRKEKEEKKERQTKKKQNSVT